MTLHKPISNRPISRQRNQNPVDSWQTQLANAFTRLDDLCRYLQIDPNDLTFLSESRSFPLRVPRSFADCMETGNRHDPLFRQIIPVKKEQQATPGFVLDPVGDLDAIAETGVIHKYQGRALLIVSGGCAIHCRYCFRRNFPYHDLQLTPQKQQQAITYIAQHPDITEVILSGGDPLILNDQKLAALIRPLQEIPHLKRIRIHSRLPVVLPSRVTQSLLACLGNSNKAVILVLHVNHSNELSEPVAFGCNQLKQSGVTLLNQSVLLKGVNDSPEQICQLSEKLFALGILPYYFHLLDKAHGTAHFEVSQDKAVEIFKHVKTRLPGYLLPKLVREVAGAAHKIEIG